MSVVEYVGMMGWLYCFVVLLYWMVGCVYVFQCIVGFVCYVFVFVVDFFQLFFVQFFQIEKFVVCFGVGVDQFIEFDLDCGGVCVLVVLDQEYYQEGDDCGVGVDYQLLGVVEFEDWVVGVLDYYNGQCVEECLWCFCGIGCFFGDQVEYVLECYVVWQGGCGVLLWLGVLCRWCVVYVMCLCDVDQVCVFRCGCEVRFW